MSSNFFPPALPAPTQAPEEQKQLWEKLLASLQAVYTRLGSILNHGVSVSHNLLGGYAEFSVVGGKFPVAIKVPLKSVSAVIVVSAVPVLGTVSLTSAVFPQWSFVNGAIKITNLSGLTTNAKYRIRILYLG